jgi:hypothetical protein
MLRIPKQQIVDLFCPESNINDIETLLARIRVQAQLGQTVRMRTLERAFECKGCAGKEAVLYSTHSTCKACGLVKNLTHQGQEWRNIQERGDLNSNGMPQNATMSCGYNHSTYVSVRDPTGKKVSPLLAKLHKHSLVTKDTKDKHILEARAAFADCCDRVHYGANANEAMRLFVRFLTSVDALHHKNDVMAACMFHTLKIPQGKAWKKTWRKKTPFNTSKKKRLKMMTFKKHPQIIKKYL